MIELAFQFVRSREAATSIEYALMASGIALVIVGAVSTLGSNLSARFDTIANLFP